MGPLAGFRSRAAFTLLEILLALALLGLVSAALVSGATHLLDQRVRTPAEVFWEAAREARRSALQGETDVRLRFDEKAKAFVVEGATAAKEFPVAAARELTINLLPGQETNSAMLIGGEVVDSRSVPSVTFYGDGTCVPFRVQIRSTGPAQIIAIDPWTCAPVLRSETKP